MSPRGEVRQSTLSYAPLVGGTRAARAQPTQQQRLLPGSLRGTCRAFVFPTANPDRRAEQRAKTMERALAATRKRHAHRLANELSTTIQNADQNAIQNDNGNDDAAIA
jgi:hypothetical protein